MPAGNPDGGQWTSGEGEAERADDEPQLAQDNTDRSKDSLVDLREEEARGGHAIRAHVNRSPEALVAQTREAFDRDPRALDARSGSFSSVEAANKLVNSTLAQNRSIVDQVVSGSRPREIVSAQFDSITGIEAVMANSRSEPVFRPTYGVGVVIEHDPYSVRGYSVLTAFPTNRRR